jgi:hypothetical protein
MVMATNLLEKPIEIQMQNPALLKKIDAWLERIEQMLREGELKERHDV